MIKVNLLKKPKKKSGFTLKLPAGVKLGGGDAEVSNRVRQLVVVGVLCAAIQYLWIDYQDSEIKKVQAQVEKVNQELQTVNQQLSQSGQLEAIKKQLEGDEEAIRKKLDTLTKLLEGRAQTYKLVKTLSVLMPKEIWVKNINVKASNFSISGGAIDYNNVSDFIKTLEDSGTFTNVVPKTQKQDRLENAGNYVSFELEFAGK